MVSILARGLAPAGNLDVAGTVEVLTRPFVLEVVWFTFWQAALSTALAVLAALPAAWIFARFDFPGRRVLWALALVPFVLPTVVVGAAFLALLGPRGPFGVRLEYTIWAILIAHVFYNYAVVLRVVGGVWEQVDPRARGGGACPRRLALARLSDRDAATADARDRIGRVDRLPVHVHVVRRDPDPGWGAVRHARGRDLSAGRAAAGPARCSHPGAAADGRPGTAAVCLCALPAARGAWPSAAAALGDGAATAIDGREARGRAQPHGNGPAHRPAAFRSGRAQPEDCEWIWPGQLHGPVRVRPRLSAVRATHRGCLELARLRRGRHGDLCSAGSDGGDGDRARSRPRGQCLRRAC